MVLVGIALVRALALGGEYYDAYEVRLGGRVLAGLAEGAVPVYRSPLLLAFSGVCELLGVGWRGPALLSVVGYAGLIAATVGLARVVGGAPWVAASCGMLVGLDRLAFAYAPHGLPGVLTAAACAGALLLALRADEDARPWARAWALGAAIGVAALLRPNAGLVGLALLAGVRPARGKPLRELPLARLVLAGAVALGLYALVTIGVHTVARGSLGGGVEAHADLRAFHAAQLAENRARYGAHAPTGAYLLALAIAAPWLALLAPCGAVVGRAARPVRVLAAWVVIHLGFLSTVPGHVEARYLLPALAALGALAAPALGRLDARLRPAQRVGVVAALAALPLLLGGRYEARRALDPVTRHAFPARLAAAVEDLRGAEGRVLWTTTHLYPVAPAVVLAGSPYPGDPFHGIYHAGPVVLSYHLRRPVTMLTGVGAGLVERAALQRFVRAAQGFRAGDVLVVGRDTLSAHWHLAERPPGPLRVIPVGPDLALGIERALVPGAADPDNPR